MSEWLMVHLGIFLAGLLMSAQVPAASLVSRPDVRAFIEEMQIEYQFEPEQLTGVFGHVRISNSVLEAIARPAEALPWYKYRRIFLVGSRVRDGVKFWKRHKTSLQRAADRYGIPAEIITAVIGVETRYGKNSGGYKVINALATLAFDYPQRASFFREQLVQFLLLTREQGLDPLTLKGSYAGAMGIPQFTPSSYRRYAVDFNDDGHTDIWYDAEDAIGSVSNYLHEHGWVPGAPIALKAVPQTDELERFVTKGLQPDLKLAAITPLVEDTGNADLLEREVKVLRLQTGEGAEYWLAFRNFYVITRYNHSALYAMAVLQLARQIRYDYPSE